MVPKRGGNKISRKPIQRDAKGYPKFGMRDKLAYAATARNMCWLVAGLYLFSGVTMFIGMTFVYNLDKKTMAEMNGALSARKGNK